MMKAIVKLFLILFIAVSCICCEKIGNDNNEQNGGQNTQEDFYYVRFEVEKDYYDIGYVSISLTGCETFSLNVLEKSFSETLGPTHKGAVAKLRVDGGSSYQKTAIYVSKNNGPFALKKQGGTNLSYTIDF